MQDDSSKSTAGIRPPSMSLQGLKAHLKRLMNLVYDLLDWQGTTISKLEQGYDVFALAGTGRGKTEIWDGFAALVAPKKKVVVVIEPLKSIEEDMVSSIVLFGRDLTYSFFVGEIGGEEGAESPCC